MVANASRNGDLWIVLRDRDGVHHIRAAGGAVCGYGDELVATIMLPDRCAVWCRPCFALVVDVPVDRRLELVTESEPTPAPSEGA